MKTTIDIPTELYRRVKAKSALLGKRVREVTIELYESWLTEGIAASSQRSPEEWVEEWIRLGEETLRKAPPAPTATEVLAADRRRLGSR
ncbi:MAG: hypothetical protein QN129_10030 [Armatimonadota bacterium]|nr:hypothetical protein [Armatimonadota bacterium]MDR7505223.1 hypothetical protein [Armatimonadota bacterium]MDR7573957.1 hypothetical protein [Armatimonadota bacterium]